MARWFAMSTGFLSDPKVERIIDRHGPNAVAVVVALMAQTMRQERAGTVELTYRTLGNESHTDRQFAFDVVSMAAETGFVTMEGGDDYEFMASFPAWERHQGNYRQQKSRASRKPTAKANVTDGHAGVTQVSPTGQDRRRQDRTGEEKSDVVPTPDAPLSELLADLIAENDPNGKRPNVTKTWATEEDRMVRLDERNPVEAERLIRWVQNDSFWRGNILSMPKFREKYGQLYQAAIEDTEKRKPRKTKQDASVDQAHRFADMARKAEAEERMDSSAAA